MKENKNTEKYKIMVRLFLQRGFNKTIGICIVKVSSYCIYLSKEQTAANYTDTSQEMKLRLAVSPCVFQGSSELAAQNYLKL